MFLKLYEMEREVKFTKIFNWYYQCFSENKKMVDEVKESFLI